MTVLRRRRANRRKPAPRDWSAVVDRGVRLLRALGVTAAVVVVAVLVVLLLDRPLTKVTIDGPFQRVTAVQLEAIVRSHLPASVLRADIADIRASLNAVDWVDRAAVRRRWPDELHVIITEQVPAARWGERGLLNTRGELFLREARHVPAELPRLDGPEGSEWQVAQRYLWMRDRLLAAGLGLAAVQLDARGAWQLRLTNGIEVRLGRDDSDKRIELFVEVVAPLIAPRAGEVAYVDMRYSNGFAVGRGEAAVRTAEVLSDA
ncbi:MAG: cell division protein FtsQ/DivIB [Gammaproteobacteria bacterium]|nr:cell division protein FtsQ/DivIB [Gammaproteobacteria bacterium]NNF62480.1 FtsQ-type POTRA domain-containing protein [Gammaproteobacteria bacterium]NNM21832.1 FtsQ-type POTRA domain-containing protein [Gammaproteobacteria bacterium]